MGYIRMTQMQELLRKNNEAEAIARQQKQMEWNLRR